MSPHKIEPPTPVTSPHVGAVAGAAASNAARGAGAFRRFLREGALDWGTTDREVLEMLVLPFLIAIGGAAIALFGKPAYKLLTREDGIAEWLQVLFYALALGGCLKITWRLRGTGRWFALYAIVCVGLFFLLGEELSWGQRLFGWGTPETVTEVNKQGETNIHNLNHIGTAFKWIQMLVGAYGVFLPLLFRNAARMDRSRYLQPWIVPHLTLLPYFGLMFVWRLFRNLYEVPQHFYYVVSEYNEILELIIAIAFFLFMRYQLRAMRRDLEAGRPAVPASRPGAAS